MRIVVADPDLQIVLPKRLARAGWTVSRGPASRDSAPQIALVGVGLATDPARVREAQDRLGDTPLVLLTRAPFRIPQEVRDLLAGLVLPAFPEVETGVPASRRPAPRLGVVTTIGPLEGSPRRLHREALRALRAAGVSGALHRDMQERLASTGAWSVPLSGAMHIAAAWGSDLRLMPMLGALAARAAREQIGIARRAGLRLESRARWLERTSEPLVAEAMYRLAGYARSGRVVDGLPSLGEVLASRPHFLGLRALLGESTPATDALDALVLSLGGDYPDGATSPGRRDPIQG